MFNAEETKAALARCLNFKITIEPSAVAGSPYDYVYVYLTEKEHEGPHAIVSDSREYEERDGYLIGVYQHFEEAGNSEYRATLEEAVDGIYELVTGELRED